MYKTFYGLARNPFDMSPDPRFFHGTEWHNEALASLYYGIDRRKGFMVLTGEVGTGKTLIARCLFSWLKWRKFSFGYVFNPLLPVNEFLQFAMEDLGLPARGKSKGELLSELNAFLISRLQRNSTVVLIIDEAHLLDWEMLEEIRLLTNLETSEHKLLQIVLLGQPELDRKLDSQDLRQLKQRVALRCHLAPLTLEQTRTYIQFRLFRAGYKSTMGTPFPEETLAAIHEYSTGTPRLINTLCENCLIAGFAARTKVISPELVTEIASDFRVRDLSRLQAGKPLARAGVKPAALELLKEASR